MLPESTEHVPGLKTSEHRENRELLPKRRKRVLFRPQSGPVFVHPGRVPERSTASAQGPLRHHVQGRARVLASVRPLGGALLLGDALQVRQRRGDHEAAAD